MEENKTGAKKGLKTFAAIVLVGGIVIGGITGAVKLNSHTDSSRAKSLVEDYTISDSLQLPKEVTVNQAYDINYCDGEDLYKAITKANIKYCEVLDEYYTSDGRDIAVVTISGKYTETINAECVEVDGQKIYMAPAGYELMGDKAYRVVNQSFTKIIEKLDDYSNIQVSGLEDAEVSVEERHTRPFEEIIDKTLIVDVPDGAVLNENQECTAAFKLVPRKSSK